MLIIELKFSHRNSGPVGAMTLSTTVSTVLELELPGDTSNDAVEEILDVLQAKYGKAYQITVNGKFSSENSDEQVAALSKARKRVFSLVLDRGYKRKHLSPFAAVRSSRFQGVVQPN